MGKGSREEDHGMQIFIPLWWSYSAISKCILMTPSALLQILLILLAVFRKQCPKLDIKEIFSRTVNIYLPNDKRGNCPRPSPPQLFIYLLIFMPGT